MTHPAFRVAIPARFASVRLPGKPLRIIAGRTLLEHVFRKALVSGAAEIVIATDDTRIRDAAEQFGAKVCMTATTHHSGTDRLAEVAEILDWPDDAIVVNLQGDEPLMPPTLIQQVAAGLASHSQAAIATLQAGIETPEELLSPHVVKVVTDAQGYALYFSRSPIPFHRATFEQTGAVTELPADMRYFRHIGLYAYRAETLRSYPRLPACVLEKAESLEQLRALWHGLRIYVEAATAIPPAGVDTEQDLARVSALLEASGKT